MCGMGCGGWSGLELLLKWMHGWGGIPEATLYKFLLLFFIIVKPLISDHPGRIEHSSKKLIISFLLQHIDSCIVI